MSKLRNKVCMMGALLQILSSFSCKSGDKRCSNITRCSMLSYFFTLYIEIHFINRTDLGFRDKSHFDARMCSGNSGASKRLPA